MNDDRDSNKFVRQQISETDRRRTEAIQQLRILQAERERNVNNGDELKSDFSRKINLTKELENDCYIVKEQIQKITLELNRLEKQALDNNRHKHDVQLLIDRLIAERNDLQGKLEQLQRTYDNCVMEVSRERAQMEAHNRHHTKLLVAKSVFMLLEAMF